MLGFWTRRGFWDNAEFAYAGLTAAAGATATSLAVFPSVEAGWRVGSASLAFVFASAVAGCKWRARVLDDQEKTAKAAEQAAAEQQRIAEIQALQDRAASQARRSISRILERLRREFFRGQAGEADTPRATLFVCCEPQPESHLGKTLVHLRPSGCLSAFGSDLGIG